jgi:hypothetical protein
MVGSGEWRVLAGRRLAAFAWEELKSATALNCLVIIKLAFVRTEKLKMYWLLR